MFEMSPTLRKLYRSGFRYEQHAMELDAECRRLRAQGSLFTEEG
jgi:hypothetical protein